MCTIGSMLITGLNLVAEKSHLFLGSSWVGRILVSMLVKERELESVSHLF